MTKQEYLEAFKYGMNSILRKVRKDPLKMVYEDLPASEHLCLDTEDESHWLTNVCYTMVFDLVYQPNSRVKFTECNEINEVIFKIILELEEARDEGLELGYMHLLVGKDKIEAANRFFGHSSDDKLKELHRVIEAKGKEASSAEYIEIKESVEEEMARAFSSPKFDEHYNEIVDLGNNIVTILYDNEELENDEEPVNDIAVYTKRKEAFEALLDRIFNTLRTNPIYFLYQKAGAHNCISKRVDNGSTITITTNRPYINVIYSALLLNDMYEKDMDNDEAFKEKVIDMVFGLVNNITYLKTSLEQDVLTAVKEALGNSLDIPDTNNEKDLTIYSFFNVAGQVAKMDKKYETLIKNVSDLYNKRLDHQEEILRNSFLALFEKLFAPITFTITEQNNIEQNHIEFLEKYAVLPDVASRLRKLQNNLKSDVLVMLFNYTGGDREGTFISSNMVYDKSCWIHEYIAEILFSNYSHNDADAKFLYDSYHKLVKEIFNVKSNIYKDVIRILKGNEMVEYHENIDYLFYKQMETIQSLTSNNSGVVGSPLLLEVEQKANEIKRCIDSYSSELYNTIYQYILKEVYGYFTYLLK